MYVARNLSNFIHLLVVGIAFVSCLEAATTTTVGRQRRLHASATATGTGTATGGAAEMPLWQATFAANDEYIERLSSQLQQQQQEHQKEQQQQQQKQSKYQTDHEDEDFVTENPKLATKNSEFDGRQLDEGVLISAPVFVIDEDLSSMAGVSDGRHFLSMFKPDPPKPQYHVHPGPPPLNILVAEVNAGNSVETPTTSTTTPSTTTTTTAATTTTTTAAARIHDPYSYPAYSYQPSPLGYFRSPQMPMPMPMPMPMRMQMPMPMSMVGGIPIQYMRHRQQQQQQEAMMPSSYDFLGLSDHTASLVPISMRNNEVRYVPIQVLRRAPAALVPAEWLVDKPEPEESVPALKSPSASTTSEMMANDEDDESAAAAEEADNKADTKAQPVTGFKLFGKTARRPLAAIAHNFRRVEYL